MSHLSTDNGGPRHHNPPVTQIKRSPNWKIEEIQILCDFVRSHKEKLFPSSKIGSKGVNACKKRQWEKAASLINRRVGSNRHWSQVRKKWKDLSYSARTFNRNAADAENNNNNKDVSDCTSQSVELRDDVTTTSNDVSYSSTSSEVSGRGIFPPSNVQSDAIVKLESDVSCASTEAYENPIITPDGSDYCSDPQLAPERSVITHPGTLYLHFGSVTSDAPTPARAPTPTDPSPPENAAPSEQSITERNPTAPSPSSQFTPSTNTMRDIPVSRTPPLTPETPSTGVLVAHCANPATTLVGNDPITHRGEAPITHVVYEPITDLGEALTSREAPGAHRGQHIKTPICHGVPLRPHGPTPSGSHSPFKTGVTTDHSAIGQIIPYTNHATIAHKTPCATKNVGSLVPTGAASKTPRVVLVPKTRKDILRPEEPRNNNDNQIESGRDSNRRPLTLYEQSRLDIEKKRLELDIKSLDYLKDISFNLRHINVAIARLKRKHTTGGRSSKQSKRRRTHRRHRTESDSDSSDCADY